MVLTRRASARDLEKDDLSLEAPYEEAYSFQRARQQSSINSQPIAASVADPQQGSGLYDQQTVTTT